MRVVAMETAKAAGARRSATGLAASVLRAVAAAILAGAVLWICSGIVAPSSAWAADAEQAVQDAEIDISADGDAARMEGCDFAVEGFECSRTGSARDIDGLSYGYTYRLSGTDRVAVVNTADYAVLFIPRTVADEFGIEDEGSSQVQEIKTYLAALDENFSTGVNPLASQEEWKVLIADAEGAEGASLAVGDATFTFGREISEDRFYVTVEGPDDAFDVKSEVRPAQMDSGRLVPAEGAVIAQKGGPLEQLGEFLATMDYSPLWVTLKTCGMAIVFVFFLGLAAAYFTLRISKRAQDIFDTVFTIPMVLPPTVCGFLLLSALGRNTAFGRFFQEIGFPLVFSWQATVIAAVVVAYQVLGGIAEWLIASDLSAALQDFKIGFPGMLLQVVLGWVILKGLAKYEC